MKRVSLRATAVMMLVTGLCWCSPAFAEDSCAITRPPRESAVGADHGLFFFVYPRHLTKSYSGCQTVWDETGRKIFQSRFAEGKLSEFWQAADSKKMKPMICKYGRGVTDGSNQKSCPEYDSVMDGTFTGDPPDDPKVPKGRDLRLAGQKRPK